MKFKSWIILLFGLFGSDYKPKYLEDIPKNISNKRILIIGYPDNHWVLVFKCPCGCKADIYLNLLESIRPRWSFEISQKGEISIRPSIRRMIGCKSHFFIKKGKIVWA